MKFLWFGKKKSVTPVELAPQAAPQEVYSVTGYICETNPQSGAKNTELSAETINSAILTLFSQAQSPADIAAQEFFQERGANVLPLSDYAFSVERGFSGRILDSQIKRTVLIGPASVIARVTTPLSTLLADAVASAPEISVVAIDGIAYAAFSITKEVL
jgi:phosphatidylserine/phosphatidylglycerophosphate/cardiolipin synthase-like enzyme